MSPASPGRRSIGRSAAAGPGDGRRSRPGDESIVEVAKANPTDGTRMVAALASRELGEPVNRKRVQRVLREHRLLQRSRNTDRRRRPGFFRVTRPDELWHPDMTRDMTKVRTAAQGWVYLHVAVDCCTREVACWRVDLRTRADEAIACVEAGLLARAVSPGPLTLGSDNGSQFTAREFREHLSARGVSHRRGGYRDPESDPESQAFIESWFGQFTKRCAWRAEWETIEQARAEIGDYIHRYHHRPHSGVGYRTPTEVAATWRPNPEPENLQTLAT